MDSGQVVRAVRRHAGMNQRDLATAAGVARSTLAAAEAGRRELSVGVLERVLKAADLDLALILRGRPQQDEELRRHLRLSLTDRLLLGLGISPTARSPRPQQWRDLEALAATARVLLEPPVAERLWLPLGTAPAVLVCVHEAWTEVPSVGSVVARSSSEPLPVAAVPVPLTASRKLYVLPPGELLLDLSQGLRAAERLLHEQAARDDAGRRRPAHRDPDVWAEGWRVLLDRRYGTAPLPREEDGRAWRLEAPASLSQQLRGGGRVSGCPDS